ncbi:MAG: hypothetical protein FWG65_04285 [Turicibacter sp.]|nr:hypothetical protein [Turicibacter sp.]
MQNIDTHQNYDKTFKESLEIYKNGTLEFLDVALAGRITEILSTEFTEITTNKTFADLGFLLSTRMGTKMGVHYEMEVEISNEDVMRFASYNINMARKHGVPFLTVVLTTNPPKATEYVNPSMTFTPKIIYLHDKDGDKVLARIREQLANGEPINELEVIYLPFYGSKSGKTLYDFLDTAIKLTQQMTEDQHKRDKLQSLLILLCSRFAKEDAFKKVLEENRMVLAGNLAVKIFEEWGIEKGKAEGKAEGIAQATVAMLKEGINAQKIAQMLNQPVEWVENIQAQQIDTQTP